MVFKCQNCGGNVIYSPEKKGMYCPYCESENSEKRKSAEGNNIEVCPDCGGSLTVEEHTSATKCLYCENSIIFEQRIEREFEPELIIPFQYSKEMTKKVVRENAKKAIFAPTSFLSEGSLNKMEGFYVPFWLFDYNANCEYRGEGTKVKSWQMGDTRYTETSYYDIYRNMDIGYQKIPVDASVKMADDIMDLIEPFQYEHMVDFKPEYMSGFNGEKYNMVSNKVEYRAKTKMESSAKFLLKQNVSGYVSVKDKVQNVRVNNQKEHYGLLPVWLYDYKFKEQSYPFYINGQTGKVIGEIPVSRAKVFSYGFTLWGILTGVLGIVYGIISLI